MLQHYQNQRGGNPNNNGPPSTPPTQYNNNSNNSNNISNNTNNNNNNTSNLSANYSPAPHDSPSIRPSYLSSPNRHSNSYNNNNQDGMNGYHSQLSPNLGSTNYTSPDYRGSNSNPYSNSNNDEYRGGKGNVGAWTCLDISNVQVLTLSRSLWNYTFLTKLMLANNRLTTIAPEISELKNLTYLDISNNQLIEIPSEVGSLFRLEELLLSNNQISILPASFSQLIALRRLEMKENPMEEPFLSLVQQGAQALTSFLLDNSSMPAPPSERPWLVNEDVVKLVTDQTPTFSVMCYNVLCDPYATRQMYGYCPTWVLDWMHRKEQILKEIAVHGADIVCLQEVETSQYHNYFYPELRNLGYEGFFYAKTRQRSMNDEDRQRVDGCATFYRTARFRLVEEHLISFSQLAIAAHEANGGNDLLNRVMPKDNIAVASILEIRGTKQALMLANSHMHWNPTFKDVKVVQTAMLLDELKRITQNSRRFNIPTVICGDFNSLPDSGVVELLANGRLDTSHPDLGNVNYGAYAANKLRHSYHMSSVYNGEMDYTNYTFDFKGVIDYVWYTNNHIKVKALLGSVSKKYLENFMGCPNQHFPSDHFPLLCELVLMK